MAVGPFGLIVLPVLGFALLWAVKLIYARGNNQGGLMQLALTIIAWVLILSGTVAVLVGSVIGWGLLVVALLIAWATVTHYRNSERLSLLHLLSISAQSELPLHVSVRAFAAERSDELGRRAHRLANLLEEGLPLADALKASKNRLPLEAEATLRLESETSGLGAGLIEATASVGRYAPLWRPVFDKLLYLAMLTFLVISVGTFLMLKIIPAFEQIFADFDTELPALTQIFVSCSNFFASYYLLLIPLIMVVKVVVIIVMLYYTGILREEIWPVTLMTRPYHRSVLLRCLARAQEAGSPIPAALSTLAMWYPRSHIRRRLEGVAQVAQHGGDWVQKMRDVGLLRRRDVDLLHSSARVGNQAWAMRQSAERNRQLLETRLNLLNNVGIPLILLCYAIPLGLVVIALMLPLVSLIQNLA